MHANPIHRPEHDLILVGGGHTHALVIRALAMQPIPGVRVTLVSSHATSLYSGMVPGVLAGSYDARACEIDLRALCLMAGVRFIEATVTGIDLARRHVIVDQRPAISFDVLSINAGITPDMRVPGASSYALPVKPLHRFLQTGITAGPALVVGGGAGGVEIAAALSTRQREPVTLLADRLLPGMPARAQQAALRRLQHLGVTVQVGARVVEVLADRVRCAGGLELPYHRVLWCTQGSASPMWQQCGLPVTAEGFIRTRATLQVDTADPLPVFAVGDCAMIADRPLPRAGVYAVRQGRTLATNLRRYFSRQPLVDFRPQREFLRILALGDAHAMAVRNGVTLTGRAVWRWKDRIDRRFMAMLTPPTQPPDADLDGTRFLPPERQCGGCGAKVGADVLSRALATLDGCPLPQEDAARIPLPDGRVALQSVDTLKPLVDDPWLMARITTEHALSDIAAMGGEPHSALLTVALPWMSETLQERDLVQILAGTRAVLDAQGARLLGGHTLESIAPSLGLAVNGCATAPLGKCGGQPGDRLLLTQPLGTGIVFAAAMRHAAPAHSIGVALEHMQRSNFPAARLLRTNGAVALTDVTGFGLAGHLLEMLPDASVGARIVLDELPLLPGVAALLEAGYMSSLSAANARLRHRLWGGALQDQRLPVVFDPQTGGGLLAVVPEACAMQALEALQAAGYAARCIGQLTPQSGVEVI